MMDEQHQGQQAAPPAVAGDESTFVGSQPAPGNQTLPADATAVAGDPPYVSWPAPPVYGAGYYPPQPPLYPAYPAPPASSMPLGQYPPYPAAYPPAAMAERPAIGPVSFLTRPFSRWAAAFVVAGAFLLLALVYTATELALHGDWAQGGMAVGYAALVLAGVAVLGTVLRVALGRKALATVALGLLLSVVLAGSGLGGMLLTNPLHHAQGYFLESSGKYVAAIHEYGLSGEAAPNAPDIARSYDEWGESFLRGNSDLEALTRFNVVITHYATSGAPVDRAYLGTFNTYVAWVRNAGNDVPYANAINYFQYYRGQSACDVSCQTTARDVEATALYQFGVALTNRSDFADATMRLDALLALFPDSAYAAQAHQEDAKAYLGLGKQQLNGFNCSDAVTSYQTLATKSIDTPEGQQAKVALRAPVSVTGPLTKFPTNPTPTMYLSLHGSQGGSYFSDNYSASVDARTGAFTFSKVKQATFYISSVRSVQGAQYTAYWSNSDNTLYQIPVGPLCTTQAGEFSYQ